MVSIVIPPPTPSRRDDEDFINRSLLDSLDEQADAEPAAVYDSDAQPAPSYGSASGSSTGSPAAPYRMTNPRHPESPGDNHSMQDSQSVLQNLYNSSQQIRTTHGGSTNQMLDRLQDHFDGGYKNQQMHNGAVDGFSTSVFMSRSPPSVSSLTSNNPISRHISLNPSFHDSSVSAPTNSIYNASESLPSRMTSPRHLQSSNFDSRMSFAPLPLQTSGPTEINSGAGATLSSFMSGQKQFGNAIQTFSSASPSSFNPPMSSQTPYGPHVPSATSVSAPTNGSNPGSREMPPEDISTIFVVGFPDDMQEREFQNMFTFSPGFEAATLKIPLKDYGPYGVFPSRTNGGSFQQNFGNSNDPYGILQQSSILNDNPRDTQWSSSINGMVNEDSLQFSNQGLGMPQRKQIIGFAKFRTRNAALEARDLLQGRRVDIEKGAVLKAEMAKKNLHTKRGVGPGGASGAHTTSGVNMLSGPPEVQNNIDVSGASSWRETVHNTDRDHPAGGEERRQRDGNAVSGIAIGQRGARIRAEELDQRRRQQLQPRLRITHPSAYDGFQTQRSNAAGILTSGSAGQGYGLSDHSIFTNPHHTSEEIASWDDVLRSSSNTVVASSPPHSFSNRSPPPSSLDSHSAGARSQISQEHGVNGMIDLTQATANLIVTGPGETSPQLPSPVSGGSSNNSVKNLIDQNPPINTLYVGNLPTTPPPTGYPQDHLECSLRDLFSAQPGFRRLCFRQKNNGPMCFVEFEDVQFATRALNDLYGNTLNGIVKGGGIRLSYSKNPLGVRTPNTGNQGPGFMMGEGFSSPQDIQSSRFQHAVDFELQSRQDPMSPTLQHSQSLNNFLLGSPPAPRFTTPSSSFSGGVFAVATSQDSSATNMDSFPSSRGIFAPFGTNGAVSERQNLRTGFDFASRSSMPTSQYRTLNSLEATRAT